MKGWGSDLHGTTHVVIARDEHAPALRGIVPRFGPELVPRLRRAGFDPVRGGKKGRHQYRPGRYAPREP